MNVKNHCKVKVLCDIMVDIDENKSAATPKHTFLKPHKFSKSNFIINRRKMYLICSSVTINRGVFRVLRRICD